MKNNNIYGITPIPVSQVVPGTYGCRQSRWDEVVPMPECQARAKAREFDAELVVLDAFGRWEPAIVY